MIVADLLGAGRSDKPDRPEVYKIRRHAQRTEQLLESLDLRDATLVPHDWGMHSLYWAIHYRSASPRGAPAAAAGAPQAPAALRRLTW